MGRNLYKLDRWLLGIFLLVLLPTTCAYTIIGCCLLFAGMDDEVATIWLNFACLFATILGSAFVLNLIILWPIYWIKDKLHRRYLDKHPEKCVSTEQLAQDFEKLAQALRESDKKEKDDLQ